MFPDLKPLTTVEQPVPRHRLKFGDNFRFIRFRHLFNSLVCVLFEQRRPEGPASWRRFSRRITACHPNGDPPMLVSQVLVGS